MLQIFFGNNLYTHGLYDMVMLLNGFLLNDGIDKYSEVEQTQDTLTIIHTT